MKRALPLVVMVASLPYSFIYWYSPTESLNSADSKKDQPMAVLSTPDPELPVDLDLKIELAVTLRAQFKKDGKVANVTVFSSRVPASMPAATLKRLEQATIDAARRIRFAPATKSGHRVSQWFILEYTFRRGEKQRRSEWRHELIAD